DLRAAHQHAGQGERALVESGGECDRRAKWHHRDRSATPVRLGAQRRRRLLLRAAGDAGAGAAGAAQHQPVTGWPGLAWRALREDTLAAEAMGMPVRRLKLLAFAIGAAIAGLSGSIFAAWQTAVFPQNFDITLLITLYAMVVLGGLGSLPGAVAGALLLSVIPELLRGPDTARLLFYGGVVAMTLL